MGNFQILTKLVKSGQVNLVHIEAVPRSVSTALARSLSESNNPSICINEPFNRMTFDIEAASGYILNELFALRVSDEIPVTVIIKNMARNISVAIFDEIVGLAIGVVWSVRDPLIQISSLLTRIANDLVLESGANGIALEDLSDEQIQLASDFLESGPKSTGFSKTSWADIFEHFSRIPEGLPSVVIDGSELIRDPALVLSEASAKLNLDFSSKMVNGWTGRLVNANTGYNPDLTDQNHAWTRDAFTSRGFHPTYDKIIDIERMPISLQDHIANMAIPSYVAMRAFNDGTH